MKLEMFDDQQTYLDSQKEFFGTQKREEKSTIAEEPVMAADREKFVYSGSLVRMSDPQAEDNKPSWSKSRPKTGAVLRINTKLNIVPAEP